LRIVMIGPFAWAPKGTVNARAALLGQALVERGHSVTLLIPPYDNPAHAGFRWSQNGVEILNMSLPTWGDSVWARLSVPPAMARQALSLQPKVVHVFKPVGYSGLVVALLRMVAGRLPMVLDSDDWQGRGGWADLQSFPAVLRHFITWQEYWSAQRADAVTVASRVLEAQMWGLGLPAASVFYMPNGPNPTYRKDSHPSSEQTSELRRILGIGRHPMALYIGHIAYDSELTLLVDALPEVIEHVPELRVVIIGSGAGLVHLRNLTLERGVSKHVLFTGWVAPSQTAVFLAAADVVLYPHRDSLANRAKSPSKITAYMAMGKPIVASNVGEAAFYLDDGRAGLLVEPGSIASFAEGIVAILRDPERARLLGQRAQERIWKQYSWDRQAETAENAYAFACAEREAVKAKSHYGPARPSHEDHG
jgi:glycosyltransferase involved in cell wall biosynthesis